MSTTISGTNGVTFPDSTSMQTGQQACKAWVNFNGTGTVAIRDGYNVSSITDNGTGDYTVNFTTAMADGNYCPAISFRGVWNSAGVAGIDDMLTNSLRVNYYDNSNYALYDTNGIFVAIFSN